MRRIALLAALVAFAAFALPPPAVAASGWAWPVRGDVVTPYRNGDDPYAAGQHRGIDVAAPVGTPVESATAGRVVHAGVVGSSGLTVAVLADGHLELSYLHLSTATVREGQVVERGDRIGAVGTTGRPSAEQAHLHFGVRVAGDRHAYRDPLDFLPPLGAPATEPQPPAAAPAPVPVGAPPAAAAAPSAPGAVVAGAPAAEPLAQPAPSAPPATAPAGVAAEAHPALRFDWSPARPGDAALPDVHGGAVAERSQHTPARAGVPASPRRNADLRPEPGAEHGPGPHGTVPSLRTPLVPRAAAAQPSGDGGVDSGWLATVVGLIAAATCLGRPRATRREAREGSAALGALLRPLTGRG
jgi:hypothetical protein